MSLSRITRLIKLLFHSADVKAPVDTESSEWQNGWLKISRQEWAEWIKALFSDTDGRMKALELLDGGGSKIVSR